MRHVFLTLMFLLLGTSVLATVYPSRLDSNTDIIVVPEAEDDLYLKHQIFSRAKHSIEMMSHLQTTGPVGGLVIDDLRNAMARGVKVKYHFEAIATMTGGGEFGLDSIPYLTDDQLYRNSKSELIVHRFGQRLKSPFALNDLNHKKIVIVDRGTPNEVIMITGRNNHEVNFKWADLTFIVRKVGGSASYLGDDIIREFDRTWSLSRQYFQVEEPAILSQKAKDKYRTIGFRPLRPTSAGQEINVLLEQGTSPGDTLASFQFRPQNVRIVTTDTLEQIVTKKLEKTLGLRPEIVDDVSNFLAYYLSKAVKVEANIYAMLLPAKIRDGLTSLAERNGEVTILTNSSESLGSALPVKTLTDAIENYGTEMFANLAAKAKDQAAEKVKMFAMVPTEGSNKFTPQTATHRKMWILEFPDSTKLSFFGSHNLTTASSSKSDEIMVAAVDNRMAEYFSSLNHRDIAKYYKKVTVEEAKIKTKSTNYTRAMGNTLFQAIY